MSTHDADQGCAGGGRALRSPGSAAAGGGAAGRAVAAPGSPNVVLITTDDQTLASLEVMKRTRALIGDRGATFERYFASYPLCCPARTTWITGQYPHNHGVIDNQPDSGGGYENLRDPERVLPAWLDAAGYDTALAGKWIHNYPGLAPPPGWDRWWGLVPATVTSYYDYELADSDGGLVPYGNDEADYQTDVLTRDYAVPYITAHAADPDPFFLHVAYTAPHWGVGRRRRGRRRCASPKPFSFDTARAKPAPRHAESFRRRELPRPPSFDEERSRRQAGDRPQGEADQPGGATRHRPPLPLRAREPARRRRGRRADRRRRSKPPGLAESTYVIFTSDNGYMHGEHRIRSGKLQPYEEAIRLPMLIRGPGIAAGDARPEAPVGDVDLVPTIMELTAAPPAAGTRAVRRTAAR